MVIEVIAILCVCPPLISKKSLEIRHKGNLRSHLLIFFYEIFIDWTCFEAGGARIWIEAGAELDKYMVKATVWPHILET